MERRNFLAVSAIAAGAAAAAKPLKAQSNKQYYYEFIQYKILNNSKRKALENYWKKAAIPALNRLGIKPVGMFKPKYGPSGLNLYVLIPHKTIDSFLTSWDKISKDKKYLENGKQFIESEMTDPLYNRYDTTLLKAFTHLPGIEIPSHIKGKKSRIFEFRIYESHNRKKAKLKMKMFNEAGEIAVFKKTGLNPVMFGEAIAGVNMPYLVYMLGFENMEERDKKWEIFRTSEGWKKLKTDPQFIQTVSGITDIIMSPTPGSQI